MIQEDGTGRGYKVKVTKNNQLVVRGEIHDVAFHQSFHHGDTYTLAYLASQAITASGEDCLAHIANTSATQLLCIDKVHVAGNDAQCFVRCYVDSVSGGDGAAFTPVNHNRTSGRVASATVQVHDGSFTDPTGGSAVASAAISPETQACFFDFQGSVILGLNDTFDVRALEQAAGTPAMTCIVTGFYIDPSD